ncbi:unnamed protein product [Calypogeia fissa]
MTVEPMENGGTHEVPDRKEEEDGPSRKLDWRETIAEETSLKEVDLETGRGGWGAPPADLFHIRGPSFFSKRVKTPSIEDSILKPMGVDWLKSTSKLEHVLSHPDNVVRRAIEDAHAHGEALKAFVLAVNLMIPGKDHHSAVFYFVTEEPIVHGSLLYRFIHEDDAFRNSRLKMINKIVRGPWIVKAACGNHAACLLGKALTCNYVRGEYYLEIDVDIGSSVIANGLLHLALGYVTSVAVDLAFLIEAQTEEELPERLLGAVRVAHMELDGAFAVETVSNLQAERGPQSPCNGLQNQSSWRRLGRSLSLLAGGGNPGRVDDIEEDECLAN